MHRTQGDGYIIDGGKRVFADEDLGSGRDATQVQHGDANSWQEEIANVIESEGYTLNSPSETISQMVQLNTAINKKVNDGDAAEALLRSGADTNLQNQILALDSTDIANASSVSGAKVTNALNALLSAISVNVPRGYIDGYTFARNGFVHTRMDFYAGLCKDSTDSLVIQYTGGVFAKSISSAWVQGSGNGGFGGNDGGPNNGTWYYTFVLYKSGQPVDFGCDNDPTGANLLAASTYTHLRRIGAVFYTGGEIRPFTQRGDWFYHVPRLSETIDLNTGSGGFNSGTVECFPDNIDPDICNVIFGLASPANNDGGSGVYANIFPSTMAASFAANASADNFDAANDSNGIKHNVVMKHCPNPETTSSHGRAMILTPSEPSIPCNVVYYCYGYEDRRGKNA